MYVPECIRQLWVPMVVHGMFERNTTSNPHLFMDANTRTSDAEYGKRKFLGYLVNKCYARSKVCYLEYEVLEEEFGGDMMRFVKAYNGHTLLQECWMRLNKCRECSLHPMDPIKCDKWLVSQRL
jgi:hypothetical protein